MSLQSSISKTYVLPKPWSLLWTVLPPERAHLCTLPNLPPYTELFGCLEAFLSSRIIQGHYWDHSPMILAIEVLWEQLQPSSNISGTLQQAQPYNKAAKTGSTVQLSGMTLSQSLCKTKVSHLLSQTDAAHTGVTPHHGHATSLLAKDKASEGQDSWAF